MNDDDPADTGHQRDAPLFVERQTYRRRRIVDAARALPVLGLMLWFVPLLWTLPDRPHSASGAIIYIFGVWAGLVVAAGLLILALKRRDSEAARGGGRS